MCTFAPVIEHQLKFKSYTSMLSSSKTTGKVHCSSRNLAHYIKRTIVYFILTVLFIPTSIAMLTMNSDIEWPAVILLCLGIFFLYKLCTCFLSMLHPEGGKLGKSLIPYTDGTKQGDVSSLFLRIDEDMATGGQKFGYLWVGREWVLGDEAMRIEHIRGIFSMKIWRGKCYEYAICLVDNHRNVQTTNVSRESQLDGAYSYLTELLPHAAQGGMDEYTGFVGMNDLEREEFEQIFAGKRHPNKGSGEEGRDSVEFVFQGTDGIPTSHVSLEMMYDALDEMEPDSVIWLTPGKPLYSDQGNSYNLSCHRAEDADRYTVAVFMDVDHPQVFAHDFALERVKTLFAAYFNQAYIPDLKGWEDRSEVLTSQESMEDYVLYVDDNRFEHITFDDITAALAGVDEGKYKSFLVRTPHWLNGYMLVFGQRDDYTVEVGGLNDEYQKRAYRTHTIYGGHVINWLSGYFREYKYPTITAEWEDLLAEVRGKNRKSTK